MNTNIVTQFESIFKLAADPILHIRLFVKKGQWQLEAIFIGGAKATAAIDADLISAIESDLVSQGWQVDASLWSNGFNAKPAIPAAWWTVRTGDYTASVSRKTGEVSYEDHS